MHPCSGKLRLRNVYLSVDLNLIIKFHDKEILKIGTYSIVRIITNLKVLKQPTKMR